MQQQSGEDGWAGVMQRASPSSQHGNLGEYQGGTAI